MGRVRIVILLLFLVNLYSQAQIKLGNQTKGFDLSYSNPKEYEIGGIEVTGVENLDENSLISVTGLSVGDRIAIPGDQISSAIKKLWNQGILGDVQILVSKVEGDFVFLELRLAERPRLSKFGFREKKNNKVENLKKTEADDLKEKLDLIRGRVITDAIKKNSERKIKNYYKEKGFLNVEVESKLEDDPVLKNSVVLNFIVKKNEKVKIREIEFYGNKAVTDSRLRKTFKGNHEKVRITLFRNLNRDLIQLDKWTPRKLFKRIKKLQPEDFQYYLTKNLKFNIFKNAKFHENAFYSDKDNLIDYYNSLGYRDAEITNDTVYQINPEELRIEVSVEEGRKYYFRDITWTGNYIHGDDELSAILNIEKGDIYNRQELDRRLNFNPNGFDVTSIYMDDGYLFFSVQPVEVRIDGDSVDMEMRIYEGEQATINEIIIKGNTVTSEEVIRREIRTYPGYKFSRRDVIRTQTFLSQLGYFNPENIGINPLPNPADGTVDIEYILEERPSNQIELSGGWGGAFGFVGSLGLVINNFSTQKMFKLREWSPLPSGDGQRLALRAQANGRRFQTYSLSFTEPWLGGRKPNSLSVTFSHSRQNLISGTEKFGHFYISGITLGLGRRLRWPDDYFVLNNTLSLLFYDLDNFNIGTVDLDGVARNFSLINSISRNSVDNPTYPRTGSQVSFSVQLTPPYSSFRSDNTFETDAERYRFIEYHKWMIDNSWYLNLVGNLVLNGRMHFGFLGSYDKDIGIPPFERFTLGGSGLTGFNALLGTEVIGLRGYDDASLNPAQIVENVSASDNNVFSPGVAFTKYVMELRYPLSLNPSATIYLQTFFEAGNNFLNFQDYNPFDLYRSVGLGARIFMPAFGLIGVDYGYGLDPVPGRQGVSGSQFHFTIGQQIR